MMTVEEVRPETPDTVTLGLGWTEASRRDGFTFKPGQFCLISVLGAGESVFCIASPPGDGGRVEVTIKKVGRVTEAIHRVGAGDSVGFRGPYGNGFPVERLGGRDLLLAGGGIGLAPLRPLIWHLLGDRGSFGDVTLVYGARTPEDLVYRYDLDTWGQRGDMEVVTAVDPGGETDDWAGEVGLVTEVVEKRRPRPDSVLVTCGPPVMIKSMMEVARGLGLEPRDVITTLEAKMSCGVGTCGRCNIGSRYVCRHGPVFTMEEIGELPDEY
jgi:NAD(P)H-flavin reductase